MDVGGGAGGRTDSGAGGGIGTDGPGGRASPSAYTDMRMGGGGILGHGGLPHMTFFWGEHAQILFSGWPGYRSHHIYFLALFLVAATAAACECLSVLTRRLASRNSSTARVRVLAGLALTAVHGLKMGLLYLVMLAVMSFNGGILIAAVAGHAFGFLVDGSGAFRWFPARVSASGVEKI